LLKINITKLIIILSSLITTKDTNIPIKKSNVKHEKTSGKIVHLNLTSCLPERKQRSSKKKF